MSEQEPQSGARAEDRSEGFGERLLGVLLDRAHEMPPHLIAPLIAQEAARVGGRDVAILLQDYAQQVLVPLPGRGLTVGSPEPMEDSPAGRAFLRAAPVEVRQENGVRMYLPLLDGSDQVGVMAVTLRTVDDDDRRLLRRLAGLVADMLVTKHSYTDRFFQARRTEPMHLAAEIQWSLLPPLSMTVPQLELAGILEPAYDVAGDSFDYALNDDILHVAMIDAMGHSLGSALLATLAMGAYRRARRADTGLAGTYTYMDQAVASQFGSEHFATGSLLRLDTATGFLQWVNAGHPAPLLIRDREVAHPLEGATTLPIGMGGEPPRVSEEHLRPGDRLLLFTDGLTEEPGGRADGEARLLRWINHIEREAEGVRAAVRALSHALKDERGGRTSDDATLLLIEWRGGEPDLLTSLT